MRKRNILRFALANLFLFNLEPTLRDLARVSEVKVHGYIPGASPIFVTTSRHVGHASICDPAFSHPPLRFAW